jgi:hypothetical protein
MYSSKLSGACQVYCCFKLACDVTGFEAYFSTFGYVSTCLALARGNPFCRIRFAAVWVVCRGRRRRR